jgi:cellulose synthase/poly-beta-1,6-N-acetylglucosamine synthase-like glycosyltransferase
MKEALRIDWRTKLEKTESSPLVLDQRKIYNAVILATYQEELDVLEPSVESVVNADFSHDRLILVLATEERDLARARKNAKAIRDKFASKFAYFMVTEHPDGITGEMKAKGANVTWAAKKLSELIKREGIDPENVIVSTADADSRFHPRYFAALAYNYVINPNRSRRSFQPLPLFSNNIWEASPMSRIMAFGSTFWQVIESTRPWRLVNFSTHSMSLATLEAIDYWDITVVNEDSRQFWRAYFAFEGDHQVVPIFLPVYMDAVMSDGFFETMKSQYQQRNRWAYGVEHFSYVVLESIKQKNIPLMDRLVKVYRLFEANFSWATASIFLAIVGWLPIILNHNFSQTVFAHNIPYYAGRLGIITWVGLISSAILSLKLMPPRPAKYRKHHTIILVLQWILTPVSAILFGSIPAIHAQTRLMLGKYMGFKVTRKASSK